MKQGQLFAAPKREKTIKSQAHDYDQRNLAAAREILANPEQFGGADAFPAIWGRLVIERLGKAAA